MRKIIYTSSLVLAGLFVYGLVLAAIVAVAGAVTGVALLNANYMKLLPGFPLSMTLAALFPGTGAACAYLLYRDAKRGVSSLLPVLAPAAMAVLLYLTLNQTVFAFTRYVAVFAAIVFVAAIAGDAAARAGWKGLSGLLAGAAVLSASLSLLLCATEAILIRQLVVDLTPSHLKGNVLNFPGDVMTGAGEDTAGNLKPGLDARISLGDGSIGRITTNSRGFRSAHELKTPKPANEFRILFLGDSFTYGYRTDQMRTAAAVLENRLNAAVSGDDRQVRVYPAWTEDQAGLAQWLREHPDRFQADLILHGVCLGNDLGTNMRSLDPPSTTWRYEATVPRKYLDAEQFRPDGAFVAGTVAREFRNQLRVTQTLRVMFAPTPISTGFEIKPDSGPLWNQQNNIGVFLKDETYADEMFAVFERNLKTAKKLAGDTPLYVALFPQRYQQSEREWRTMVSYYGLRADAFDLDLPNRKIRAICDRNDFNCFDLLPVFRERGEELLHYPYDMHWNDAGNALAGQAMAEYLLKQ
ncbi:MAG: SGNH/GDSL hydrolase family protein [Leptospirales bacterium]